MRVGEARDEALLLGRGGLFEQEEALRLRRQLLRVLCLLLSKELGVEFAVVGLLRVGGRGRRSEATTVWAV